MIKDYPFKFFYAFEKRHYSSTWVAMSIYSEALLYKIGLSFKR